MPLTISGPCHWERNQSRSSKVTDGSNIVVISSFNAVGDWDSEAKLNGSVVSRLNHQER